MQLKCPVIDREKCMFTITFNPRQSNVKMATLRRFLTIAIALALILWPWTPCRAIVCYHCDSIASEACAMTLGEVGVLPYVECASELTCIMSIVDSITYRGCGSDTPTTGASYKKTCSSNLCNAGVYPPGRLKCHHCAGESCVAPPLGRPRPCRYHHEEDQCYTEVLNATTVFRGCASDSNHTVAGAAQYCEINGCNEAQAASQLICARCDSNEGRGCKMDLFQVSSGQCNVTLFEQCVVEQLLTQEPQSCFTYRRLSRVVRGCTAQLPPDVAADAEHLVTCTSADQCNVRCTTQQRCLTCNSAENELCLSNATLLTTGVCASAETSSCYACEYADWSVRRGCGSSPRDAGIGRCYECDADGGCNSQPFTRCYQCSSSGEAGAACATWERPGGIYIEECEQPAAACLMASYTNGTTVRGCQRTDFNCTMAGVLNCRSCEGSFCNKGAFPEQRLWCHQCAGGAQCEAIAQDPMPCALAANEPAGAAAACLEYYDSYSKQVVRGCRTNAQLYYECMLRSGNCQLCRSNGCNRSPLPTLQEHALALFTPKASSACTLRKASEILWWFCVIYAYNFHKLEI